MAKHQKLTVGELRERLDRFSDKATIAVILGLTAGKVTAASLVVEIGGADHLLYQFQRISDHSGAIQFIGSGVKKQRRTRTMTNNVNENANENTVVGTPSDSHRPLDGTVEELLAQWDAGQTIRTVEMGGLGPGYEQAIQIMAVEFARALSKSEGHQEQDMAAETKRVDEICDEVMRRIDRWVGGASGAQYGAARHLAWRWCYQEGGPKAVYESAPEDRQIFCSKWFPRAEAANGLD